MRSEDLQKIRVVVQSAAETVSPERFEIFGTMCVRRICKRFALLFKVRPKQCHRNDLMCSERSAFEGSKIWNGSENVRSSGCPFRVLACIAIAGVKFREQLVLGLDAKLVRSGLINCCNRVKLLIMRLILFLNIS